MTRSELIEHLKQEFPHLYHRDVVLAVKALFGEMSNALSRGDRIELRGFGSFSTRRRNPRQARNPRTGGSVKVGNRYSIYFRAGKALKDTVDS